MDRNRETRRVLGSNGFNRRKHRTNNLRDSPDEETGLELQESVKLRERVKKDRDVRGRELRERERERDLRERSISRSKRRRGERLMANRDEIGTSEDSENDDFDEEYDETSVRFPTNHHSHNNNNNHHHHNSDMNNHTSNSVVTNSSNSQYHNLQQRKSFSSILSSSNSAKMYKTVAPVWKPGDEMIGVSVPRKARSASTKRLHDWASSSSQNNGGNGDQILRQASNSPVQTGLVSTPSPAPPMSPSSSNASTRKKLKQSSVNVNGSKQKPPKATLKPCSSNPEELEIEIAEVLYGLMTQTSKKEDSPKEINKSASDSKSISNNSLANNNNNQEHNSAPLTAVVPKRKRPRQILENSSYGARAGPKSEMDLVAKPEFSERVSGFTGENGLGMRGNLVNNAQVQLVEEKRLVEDSKQEMLREARVSEEANLAKEKESNLMRKDDFNRAESGSVSGVEIKGNPVQAGIENLRQEKFQIDLMAPPPQVRSSPERESRIYSKAQVVEEKPVSSVLDLEMKLVPLKDKENENGKRWRDESTNVVAEEKKGRIMEKDAESGKGSENKVTSVDLKLDLANGEKDGVNVTGNKAFKTSEEELLTEKTGQSTNLLPIPISMASWPGGLPPMGYMAPLQGLVPMDGATVPPMPLQSFAQPRPKRCATHSYIARNIRSLQQYMKINPPQYYPPAPGPAALFGSKPFGNNFTLSQDLQNVAVRAVHNVQEKGQSVANVQNQGAVKEKSSQSTSTPDSAQRKQQQILIQQALPSVPPSNIMAPAFIFPLNQHQAAIAAASVRPNTGKSSNGANTATTTSSIVSNSAAGSTPPVPAGGPTNPMNFNYPNMSVNETQYLAILQSNGYPFTIPSVGPPANYRGTPGQAMPFGSFYPSQMIHPSQIQPQPVQIPQNSNASGNSSSQKNSQRSQPGNSKPQNFPSQKPQQLQQESESQQQSQNQQRQQQQRNHENETGSENSPSTNLRASVNIYSQNFTMPMHPQNYAMVAPPNGSGNQSEKKPQQAPQQPPHSFAMSFGSINGAVPGVGIDLASMAQNNAFFQSFPEAARQNMQMMAAAQKKNFRVSEDGNNANNRSGGGDSSATDDERKNSKSQSIAFTRSDLADPAAQASNVVESSSRPGSTRNAQAMNSGVPSAHIQSQTQQQQHQQQQQMMQLMQHRQQQLVGNSGNNRNKTQVPSNGSLYPEHLNSSSASMPTKFPNTITGFPQNLVQSNSNSPNQSPPWKNSSRAPSTSQAPSSITSSNPSTIKNLPQQHNSQIRPQMHNQISFGGSQKRPSNSPGQAPPSNSPAQSAIGSPTTSSVSKGAAGSPRMTNSVPTNKMTQAQASALSAQQSQNAQPQKSLSVLGNPSSGKQQSQQQMPKNMQHAQLFFSNPYTQAQSPHSTGSNSGPGGYFMQQRRRAEQQQTQGGPSTPSNGMLSLGSSGTNDPAKAIAVATSNMKVGGLPTQGMMHAAQFAAQSSGMVLPAGFAYVHPVPSAVHVKPAEQKQPAGQPEKK